MQKLIVGVDPGLNCGLAILKLDGTPILIESHRGWSLANIIERVREIGEPTIVSSDVSPAPSLLERLSIKLNAVLFEPALSMSAEEKHRLVKSYVERYNVRVENAHEVDALAAAIKAYQHYKNKFERVDAKLKEIGSDLTPDDVKDLVARGYSVTRAIKTLEGRVSSKMLSPVKRTETLEEKMRKTIKELTERLILERERNRLLKAANKELQLKIRGLIAEIEELKGALEKARSEQAAQIRREREYQRLIEEIKTLQNRILEQEAQIKAYKQMLEHFQHLSSIESREKLILLKPIESFTREGLEKSFRIYNVRVGDVVFILDPSGGGSTTAEILAKRGVRAIVIRGVMSHQALETFERYLVPVIPADNINIKWIEGLPYADPEEIKKIVKEGKTIKSSNGLETLKAILEDHLREVKEGKRGQN
jgi:predicted RNase H-like nuclease (RuvC/YqgF family)